jgi:hypothetical protein
MAAEVPVREQREASPLGVRFGGGRLAVMSRNVEDEGAPVDHKWITPPPPVGHFVTGSDICRSCRLDFTYTSK